MTRAIADMLEENQRQRYLLRTGHRAYSGPAYRERPQEQRQTACTPPATAALSFTPDATSEEG